MDQHPSLQVARDPGGLPQVCVDLLDSAFSRARAELAPLELPVEAFRAKLSKVVLDLLAREGVPPPPTTDQFQEMLSSLVVGDLYLATAMECGNPLAWQEFSSRYDSYVRQICRYFASGDSEAIELCQSFGTDLFLAPRDGALPRIASYRGQGSLKGWLKVLLRHLIEDRRRARSKLVSLDSQRGGAEGSGASTLADRLPAPGDGPDSVVMRLRCQEAFERAVPEVPKDLSDREKCLLNLYFVHGIQGNRLAPMFKVHESTLSRWLENLRHHVKKTIERVAQCRCGMSRQDVQECYQILNKGFTVGLGDQLENLCKKPE